jgi:hypothetical protein
LGGGSRWQREVVFKVSDSVYTLLQDRNQAFRFYNEQKPCLTGHGATHCTRLHQAAAFEEDESFRDFGYCHLSDGRQREKTEHIQINPEDKRTQKEIFTSPKTNISTISFSSSKIKKQYQS